MLSVELEGGTPTPDYIRAGTETCPYCSSLVQTCRGGSPRPPNYCLSAASNQKLLANSYKHKKCFPMGSIFCFYSVSLSAPYSTSTLTFTSTYSYLGNHWSPVLTFLLKVCSSAPTHIFVTPLSTLSPFSSSSLKQVSQKAWWPISLTEDGTYI